MTADTPHWDLKAKSSNYRVSQRYSSYVQVSPDCLNCEIFQLIPLENITSIFVYSRDSRSFTLLHVHVCHDLSYLLSSDHNYK